MRWRGCVARQAGLRAPRVLTSPLPGCAACQLPPLPPAGLWCFPGGSLELGETLVECAVREVGEETGLRLNNAPQEGGRGTALGCVVSVAWLLLPPCSLAACASAPGLAVVAGWLSQPTSPCPLTHTRHRRAVQRRAGLALARVCLRRHCPGRGRPPAVPLCHHQPGGHAAGILQLYCSCTAVHCLSLRHRCR